MWLWAVETQWECINEIHAIGYKRAFGRYWVLFERFKENLFAPNHTDMGNLVESNSNRKRFVGVLPNEMVKRAPKGEVKDLFDPEDTFVGRMSRIRKDMAANWAGPQDTDDLADNEIVVERVTKTTE